MKFRHYFPLLVPALLAGGIAAWADEGALDALVHNSPFGARATQAEASAPAAAGPEFRGYYAEGRDQFFSIYDPASRQSYWMRRGESAGGLSVKDFAANHLTLNVEYQGRTLPLSLRTAKIVAAAILPGTPPASMIQAIPSPSAGPKTTEVLAAEQILVEAQQRQVAFEERRKIAAEKRRQQQLTIAAGR